MANLFARKGETGTEEKEVKWTLKEEQEILTKRLHEMDPTSEEYERILKRIQTVNEILCKRKDTRSLIAKAVGAIVVSGVTVFFSYRNDLSEHPVFNKSTQGLIGKITGIFRI